jgi:hypothetical protein
VKQHLGLPFLGMVPALFDKALENAFPELLKTFATAVEQGDHLLIQAMLAHQIPTFAPFLKGEPT